MPDLKPLFWPESVAIVGASPDPVKIRGRLLDMLIRRRFPGRLLPVNPNYGEIQGLPAYPAITAVPGPVDLALIAIPAAQVPDALSACAAAGVKSAVVYSSGFAEAGAEARALQDRIAAVAQETGLAVVGPNAVGVYNVLGRMAASFSPGVLAEEAEGAGVGPRSRIAVVSQSGGIGFSIFNRGVRRGLAFSHVVTSGNEAALGTLDFVDYLIDDEATGAFVLFLEGMRNADRFLAVAARAAEAGKPLIVAKVGRSGAAKRAAASHTASMVGADTAYDAVFHHAGVIRAEDQDELLDYAAAFTSQPLAKGRRVGIVTITGGGGAWMSDALTAHGLEIPELDAARQAEVRQFIPAYGAASNPIDITAQAMETGGRTKAIEILYDCPAIDTIVVVATLADQSTLLAEHDDLLKIAARAEKPILFYSYTIPTPENLRLLAAAGIPVYTTLHGCARAVAGLADYHAFLSARAAKLAADDGPPPPRIAADRPVLTEHEAAPILAAMGIPTAEGRLVTDEAAAVEAAEALGYPVVLKAQSPAILHKTEIGAVAVGIADPDALRAAYRRIAAAAEEAAGADAVDGILVQRMMPKGREMIAGVVADPDFGPLVMVGLGGIHVEAMRDVAFAPVPITRAQATALIGRLHGRPLLDALRGARAADIPALSDLLVALSRLADANRDRIAEIDLNPVALYDEGEGLAVLDALIVMRAEVASH